MTGRDDVRGGEKSGGSWTTWQDDKGEGEKKNVEGEVKVERIKRKYHTDEQKPLRVQQ